MLTTIDDHGRVADRSLIRLLGWAPGHAVDLTVVPAVAVLVAANGKARHAINGQGHLQLPAPVRRCCGLEPGDQLLLAANPDGGLIVAYTMTTLDEMIRTWHPTAQARR